MIGSLAQPIMTEDTVTITHIAEFPWNREMLGNAATDTVAATDANDPSKVIEYKVTAGFSYYDKAMKYTFKAIRRDVHKK